MTEHLRRLLGELADQAPVQMDPAGVRRLARRRAGWVTGAASAVAVGGVVAAAVLYGDAGVETLQPAPPANSAATQPSVSRAASSPPAGAPTPAASGSPGEAPAGLPAVVYAAQGSRLATFRSSDGSRSAWLSDDRPGYGALGVALASRYVLFGLGSAEQERRAVYVASRSGGKDNGAVALSEPGGFAPAVLADGSRYAFLATGDDAAYSPRSPEDLRLVLHEENGSGVQAVLLDRDWVFGGLAFASPDRIVLSADREPGGPGAGLQVYDFRTDQGRLGSREPDTRFLSAPTGCEWTLPTATPVPDQLLVLERCDREDGGERVAVVVSVSDGTRLSVFGKVQGSGPGQVDSLDLDGTGQHLLAQVHNGGLPPATPEAGSDDDGDVLTTTTLGSGRTLTVTQQLVTPVWE